MQTNGLLRKRRPHFPLNNGKMAQIFAHFGTKKCDSSWIAPKVRNVVMDPTECQLLVAQSHVAGHGRVIGQVEETESTQPVIDVHNN